MVLTDELGISRASIVTLRAIGIGAVAFAHPSGTLSMRTSTLRMS